MSRGYYYGNYLLFFVCSQTFIANTDQNTAVTNMFGNPVIATYVRILPKEYQTMIGMRMDILGCLAGEFSLCAPSVG